MYLFEPFFFDIDKRYSPRHSTTLETEAICIIALPMGLRV